MYNCYFESLMLISYYALGQHSNIRKGSRCSCIKQLYYLRESRTVVHWKNSTKAKKTKQIQTNNNINNRGKTQHHHHYTLVTMVKTLCIRSKSYHQEIVLLTKKSHYSLPPNMKNQGNIKTFPIINRQWGHC